MVKELDWERTAPEMPPELIAVIADADARIDRLFDTEQNRKVPKYLPSDHAKVFSAMHHVTENGLPLGRTFCEWGSGFGVASCMAAQMGYESYGIEIEPLLAEQSREMAEQFGLDVTILHRSYVPEGFESYSGLGGEELMWTGEVERGIAGYEGMETTLDEVDLFFVYPWPDEEEFFLNMFDAVAGDGAILIICQGDDVGIFLRVVE